MECKLHCTHVTVATRKRQKFRGRWRLPVFTNFSSLVATRKAPVVTLQRRQVHPSMMTVTVARQSQMTTLFIVHMLTITTYNLCLDDQCILLCITLASGWPLSPRAPTGIFDFSICWDYITITRGMCISIYMYISAILSVTVGLAVNCTKLALFRNMDYVYA